MYVKMDSWAVRMTDGNECIGHGGEEAFEVIDWQRKLWKLLTIIKYQQGGSGLKIPFV